MASSGWVFDPVRSQYYRVDTQGHGFIYQDGSFGPVKTTSSESHLDILSTATHRSRLADNFSSLSLGGPQLDSVSIGHRTPASSTGPSNPTGVIRNEHHNIIQDMSGRETSLDPYLLNQGVKAVVRIGPPRDQKYETLDPKFKRMPKGFYQRGKVFRILWPEPAGSNDQGSVYSSDAFNEKFHMKIRWFVVIREGATFCSCLPITTYNGQGVGKATVVKEEHSIIYTGDSEPKILQVEQPGYGEKELRPSIRVRSRSRAAKLDPLSRLNYAKVYTVEHNVKVYEFGDVHRDSMRQLLKNFKAVWKMDVSSSGTAKAIVWERNEDTDEDEEDDSEEANDEEDDDDKNDDDSGVSGKTVEMDGPALAVHNLYVSHYVEAYRRNQLDALAEWLQHAPLREQAIHIKHAQEMTRKMSIQRGPNAGKSRAGTLDEVA